MATPLSIGKIENAAAHTPITGIIEETIARPFDAEIWIGREAPPLPDVP